jgi:hypothetical protein
VPTRYATVEPFRNHLSTVDGPACPNAIIGN